MSQLEVASGAPWGGHAPGTPGLHSAGGACVRKTVWCQGSAGLRATPLPRCRSPSGSRWCLLQSIMVLAHLQAAVLCVQGAIALPRLQSRD